MTNDPPRLPDASEEINDLRRQETIDRLKRPALIIGLITGVALCLIAVGTGAYYLLKNAPSTTPTAAIAAASPTLTPTYLTTVAEPAVEATPTTTIAPPAPATSTQAPAEPSPTETPAAPADTPTPQPASAQPPSGTPTPVPSKTAPTPATLDTAQLPGKIAVPVFNGNTYDLYIASAPGWKPELFQNAASQPAFSPDGAQIVFRSWGGSGTPYSEQLVTRALGDSNGRLITTHPEDARPHWGNSSMPIVFHSRPSRESVRIYLQGLWEGALNDPNGRRPLVVGENPTWLPDGRIVYFSGEPSGTGLYVMSGDGGSPQLLWSTPNTVAPKGAPQSNRVVFSNNDDLYQLTVADGASEPQLLLSTPARELLPVWSPDEQYVAYARDESNNAWAVYVIRADGTGEATKLFDLPGSIDGKPSNVPPEKTFGWREEQLAWGP
jgi:hypothetical protein